MDYRGVIDIPKTWYESLDEKKKSKVDKKILKEWHIRWEDCSDVLKSLIYQKERGK